MAPTKKPPRSRQNHYIREWRNYRGLSQVDAAAAIDCAQSKISKIEIGTTPYDQDFLEDAARVYQCTPWDLIKNPPSFKPARREIENALATMNDEQLSAVNTIIKTLLAASS